MKISTKVVIILIVILVIGTSVLIYFGQFERKCSKFISKFENEEFKKFENTSFLILGYRKKYIVIKASVDFKNAYSQEPYIVYVNQKTGIVEKINDIQIIDHKLVDVNIIYELIPRFLEYNIRSLAVDSLRNVYIRLEGAEKPTLIRFSNIKHKSKQYNKWKRIKGNWYFNPFN